MSALTTESGSASVNPDLASVHKQLISIVAALDAAVGRATTGAEVTALLDEIAEVNARVTSVGRQLFTQQTAQIKAKSEAVAAAADDAKKVIAELKDVKALVQGVTKFLAVVDKAVDAAKVVI